MKKLVLTSMAMVLGVVLTHAQGTITMNNTTAIVETNGTALAPAGPCFVPGMNRNPICAMCEAADGGGGTDGRGRGPSNYAITATLATTSGAYQPWVSAGDGEGA